MLSKKNGCENNFFAESPKIALGKEISLPRAGEDLSAKRSLPRA
jgi:hypothetical protein